MLLGICPQYPPLLLTPSHLKPPEDRAVIPLVYHVANETASSGQYTL
jgi:hypothetical protein